MPRRYGTYYAVPDHYTIGPEFDTLDEAVEAAIKKILGYKKENDERGSLIPLATYVDQRDGSDYADYVVHRYKVSLEVI